MIDQDFIRKTLCFCCQGKRCLLASFSEKHGLSIDLIPERVGSANSRKLFRNGATAKKNLPKKTFASVVRGYS